MIPYFSFEKIGPFYTWGIFLALGFLTPFVFVLKQAKKQGINPQMIWDIFLWIVIASLIGMRLGYIFQFPSEFFQNPIEIVKFWDGGLTFYGGLIGGITGAVVFKKTRKLSKEQFWEILDIIALYFPLGIIVARIGCFLINDHQGAITTFPWGIIWPDGTIRHPVALYLILNGLLIFLILNLLKDRLKKPSQLFFFFLLFYSLTRFLLDFTRSQGTILSDPYCWDLSFSQWISLLIVFVSVNILLVKKPNPKKS